MGSIRVSALSRLRMQYVFTHDSIGVGFDGPTHQPVELVSMLRSIPRPCRLGGVRRRMGPCRFEEKRPNSAHFIEAKSADFKRYSA